MTESQEDYLETIYLITQNAEQARVKDIAERMNVKKPSVNSAMKELAKKGYIAQERYGGVELTDSGVIEAKKILEKHIMLKSFLTKILNVSDSIAEKDACRMEHALHSETIEKLKSFMENYSN